MFNSNSLIVPSALIMYHPLHLQYFLDSTENKICSQIVLDLNKYIIIIMATKNKCDALYYLYLN